MYENSPKTVDPLLAQVVAFAILLSTLVYAVVGTLLVRLHVLDAPIMPAAASSLIAVGFLFAGVAGAMVSFLVRRLLVERWLSDGGTLEARLRIVIVSMAIAESSGVLGLVYVLLSSTLAVPFLLWGCSLVAAALHFPRRSWLTSEGTRH
jgi:hypothetical protein